MKMPMFSTVIGTEDLTAYREQRVISANEQIAFSKRYLETKFCSRQVLLRWGKQYDGLKFPIGKYLATYLEKLGTRRVLSLGCGECYHEYAIKNASPSIYITAVDFDSFRIGLMPELLPEIDKTMVFDVTKDDFAIFKGEYDVVLMIGLIYALTNEEIVSLLNRVRVVGAKHIIIVASAFINNIQYARYTISKLLSRNGDNHKGRFHGWARSRGEVLKIFKKADGIKVHRIITGKPFNKNQAMYHLRNTLSEIDG